MTEQSSTKNSEGRVLKFRPRGALFSRPLPQQSPVEDLGKYEGNDAPDDFRHRMLMNIAVLVATIMLVAAGVWIANSMAQMRKNQDCVLTGRPGCTPVDVPAKPRW